MMKKETIEILLNGRSLTYPLFYNFNGGLRFGLCEGEKYISLLMSAHRKAKEICEYTFKHSQNITVCFQKHGGKSLLSLTSFFRSLVQLGFDKPEACDHWMIKFEDDCHKEIHDVQLYWHYFLFNVPKTYLDMLLWIPLVNDYTAIQPSPGNWVYLIDIEKETIVMPYDDRGMDIVGNNHEFLKELYYKFNHYLLDYDRETMDITFSE